MCSKKIRKKIEFMFNIILLKDVWLNIREIKIYFKNNEDQTRVKYLKL